MSDGYSSTYTLHNRLRQDLFETWKKNEETKREHFFHIWPHGIAQYSGSLFSRSHIFNRAVHRYIISMPARCWIVAHLFWTVLAVSAAFGPVFPQNSRNAHRSIATARATIFIIPNDEPLEPDDEEEEEEEDPDPYAEKASSEFLQDETGRLTLGRTTLDWGGALGKLRERVDDVESGKSQSPSNTLFRLMTSQTPSQTIGNFIQTANPQVVAAMSGAVNSLLGGLSNPAMGVEMIVKASGEKIGSLCFQLQMTGYMFRNAEYVLALKDIMNLRGSKSMQAYKEAFDRLDADKSGYVEKAEIEALLKDVYNGKPVPSFEIKAFMEFFDANGDGKISWNEFKESLGDMSEQKAAKAVAAGALLPTLDEDDDDDDDDEGLSRIEPNVSGMIEFELKDGNTIEVDANEYLRHLKEEANALKAALRQEKGIPEGGKMGGLMPPSADDMLGGSLTGYIASREGDLKSLTEGMSQDVVDTMKQLVDFVLEGGDSKRAQRSKPPDADQAQMEMELPGAALQQLALWQLVLGYRLREAEATGEYMRLLDN
jgi:Ca2+-binding EF-hand superfamily protein